MAPFIFYFQLRSFIMQTKTFPAQKYLVQFFGIRKMKINVKIRTYRRIMESLMKCLVGDLSSCIYKVLVEKILVLPWCLWKATALDRSIFSRMTEHWNIFDLKHSIIMPYGKCNILIILTINLNKQIMKHISFCSRQIRVSFFNEVF